MPHRVFTRKGRYHIEFKDRTGRRRYEAVAAVLGIPPDTVTPDLAQEALAKRLGEVGGGAFVPARARRLTFAQALGFLKGRLEARGLKRETEITRLLDRLAEEFGTVLCQDITEPTLEAWVAEWRGQGIAPATINKRLTYVNQALKLAAARGHLARPPQAPRLRVKNARQGFVGRDEYDRLLPAVSAPYRPVVAFLWESGWRREEATALRWEDVDLETAQARAVDTKNGEDRVLPLVGELRELVAAQLAARDPACPFVFQRQGHPIGGRRLLVAFKRAAASIGKPGLILHDLRRSAVREMEMAGVPRAVAMRISGHRSESIYRRYAIVSGDDLADGLRRRAGVGR